jgi:hypothetical protein
VTVAAGRAASTIAAVSTAIESARGDWEDGHRRFARDARDRARGEPLHRMLEVLIDELRRRVGQTFTLGELADAYASSERWAGEAVEERAAAAGWPALLSVALDEAFHRYSRGAVDYAP